METECYSRENPSVTQATREVGRVLSSRSRTQACQSLGLLEHLVVKLEDGETINKERGVHKESMIKKRKQVNVSCYTFFL